MSARNVIVVVLVILVIALVVLSGQKGELHTEIEIDASPAEVWAVLVDLEAYADWNPFVQQASGEVREGTKLEVTIGEDPDEAMNFRPTVTRVVSEREFRWLGRLLMPGVFDGEHIFEIIPAGDGSVRFVQRENFRGILVPFLKDMLETDTRRGFEAMNRALKERVES